MASMCFSVGCGNSKTDNDTISDSPVIENKSEQPEESTKELTDNDDTENTQTETKVEKPKDENTILDETNSNITFAAKMLGESFSNGTLNISDEQYEFVSNDVYMLDVPGRIEHAFTKEGEERGIVDMMTWCSNDPVSVEKKDEYISFLKDKYSQTKFLVKQYYDYSDNAYVWGDIPGWVNIVFWTDSQDRANIRWIYPLPYQKPIVEEKKPPRIGMTEEEVLASSWGKPKDKNKTTTAYGVHEQWVYNYGRYVYFDDGIVTSIQE